jgi:uncharacterized protein DUF547
MPIRTLVLTVVLFAATIPAAWPVSVPDIAAYDGVLQRHVTAHGKVRYGDLRNNLEPLDSFVRQIAAVSPHSHPELFPDNKAELAYWINTYNSLVLWAFASEYPEGKNRLSGLIGRGLFFYKRKFPVGGKKLTLAQIENDIVREEFDEPRIHFALVCASESCPWLANRAYTAAAIEEMLEAETRRFLNQDRNVQIDREARVLHLSKLFDWYGKDFGATEAQRLAFVARYRKDGEILTRGKWRIRHFGYDWSPNDAPTSTH